MKIVLWLVGGFAAFLIIGNALYDPADPRMRAQMAIDECWSEQAKKSNDPAVARFMAGACESMEAKASAR